MSVRHLEERRDHTAVTTRRWTHSAAADTAVVMAIANTIGTGAALFTTREVLAHATIDGVLDRALRAAGIRSARQLGKRLRRITETGSLPPGVRLSAEGKDRDDAIVWEIGPA